MTIIVLSDAEDSGMSLDCRKALQSKMDANT